MEQAEGTTWERYRELGSTAISNLLLRLPFSLRNLH